MDVFHISIVDTSTVSIFPQLKESTLQVYPNPLRDEQTLTVEPGFWEPVIQWKLFNAKGQLVSSQSIRMAAHQQEFSIDAQAVADGMYLLQVFGTSHQGFAKIVVGR